jgi:hypothetical protein
MTTQSASWRITPLQYLLLSYGIEVRNRRSMFEALAGRDAFYLDSDGVAVSSNPEYMMPVA